MATVAQFNQDQNQQNPNSGGSGQVLNSAGSDGSSGMLSGQSGSDGGGSTPAYSQARAPLSGAPNIQQYLQANAGAGQKLSQGIQNNVQQQAQSLDKQVGSYQQQLQGQYQPLAQNLGESGQQNIQSAFQNPQQLLDAYNAAKTQSSNQPLSNDQQNQLNQYNQFQQLASQGYNPGIQSYGAASQQAGNTLQGGLSNIQQQAQLANTEMGRSRLLQNINQPNYNLGQQSLDSLLLQAQPGTANQLQQGLSGIASQAGQNVNAFNSDAQSKLAALHGLSSQNQQAIQNLFTSGQGGMNDISGNVGNEVQAAIANQQAIMPGLVTASKNNSFTPEQLQQLGLQSGMHTWGVNADPFLSSTDLSGMSKEAQNAAVANPEEFGRYNALNNLLGTATGTNVAQPSIFGTATQQNGPFNPANFDTTGFQNAINAKQNALQGTDFQNFVANKFNPALNNAYMTDVVPEQAINKIQQMISNHALPPEVMAQLKDPTFQAGLTNAASKRISDAGLNQDFVGDTMNKYNSTLNVLQDWLNKTYNPAAGAALGPMDPGANQGRIIHRP